MDTRKVQWLGPSTLAMTLPAEWAREHGVEKGDEVTLRQGSKGALTMMPESADREESEAIIHADELDAAAVERDYDRTSEVRELFKEISDREREILGDLPEMSNEDLLQVREVLVSLQQTAQYAMRNAEIAANLALNEESEHVSMR